MVNIMLGGAEVQQSHKVCGAGTGNLAGQEQKRAPQHRQEEGWGQRLAYHDRAGNSSKCIFWSAIALGALLQGCSLAFVSPPGAGHGSECFRFGTHFPPSLRKLYTVLPARIPLLFGGRSVGSLARCMRLGKPVVFGPLSGLRQGRREGGGVNIGHVP